ncbi:MAG: glycosyltransferase [Vicinamibacterales bacterium]
MKIVYVTYDGLEDPLGQSQVRPYVEGLARRGHRFEIVSFEKPGVPTRWRERLFEGVHWTALRYHRHPTVPATAYDMSRGLAVSALIGLLRGAELIHARSYVPAAFVLPLTVARGTPLLFDTRGFWPEEKVDGGAWPADDPKYRAVKRIERTLFRRASAIAVVTLEAQRYLREEYPFAPEIAAPIHVIPGSVDLELFSPRVPPDPALAPRLSGARVLGYVGSLGTWYMDEAIGRFYLEWRKAVQSMDGRPTRLLVVTRSDPGDILRALQGAGVSDELVPFAARHTGVPPAIRWAEAAVSFRQPSPSSRAGSPVKFGELLACGIPVVTNTFGDTVRVFHGTSAGIRVEETTDEALRAAAYELASTARRDDVRDAARALAARWFHLAAAVSAYHDLYAAAVRPAGSSPPDVGWPRTS